MTQIWRTYCICSRQS